MHEGRCESLSGLNCKKARVKKILVSNFGGSVLLRGKCFAEGNVFRRRKCVSQESIVFRRRVSCSARDSATDTALALESVILESS